MTVPSNIDLTVAIPTYNGGRYLAETIDSVLCQLPDVKERRVEILISDNASTDNTSNIVNQYLATYPEIFSYNINTCNLGYDRNVDKLFKIAQGEYVWLLGDDDTLVSGALKRFFSVSDQHKDIAIFVIPPSFLSIETQKKLWDRQLKEDVVCIGGDEFLQQSLWGTASLSSLCILKELWNAENVDMYIGSQWVHIGGMIQIMRHKRKAYLFADEMVIVRIANPRWGSNGNQLEIGLKHLAVFENILKLGYDSRTFECFLENRFASNFKDILFLAPSNIKNKLAIAKTMIHFFYAKLRFWLFDLPLLFIPNTLRYAIVRAGRYVKQIVNK